MVSCDGLRKFGYGVVVGSPDGAGVRYLAMFEEVISCKVRGSVEEV